LGAFGQILVAFGQILGAFGQILGAFGRQVQDGRRLISLNQSAMSLDLVCLQLYVDHWGASR
jgi:hypothetical protein